MKLKFTIFIYIFSFVVLGLNPFSAKAQESFASSPPATKQQICKDSPQCYWEDPNCICANGVTPQPSGKITWNEVQGYNGSSFTADKVEDVQAATNSGNIFKNATSKISSTRPESTPPKAEPSATPTIPPFQTIQEIKEESPNLVVKSVEKVQDTLSGQTKNNIKISGIGPVNTQIYIYIFSDPIIVSVKTNSKGEWSYVLEKSLDKGNHKIYVAAKQSPTELLKSKVVDITIVQAAHAQSGSAEDFDVVVSPTQDIYNNFLRNALIILFTGLAFVIVIIKLFNHRKRN